MAARTIHVEFLPADTARYEVSSKAQLHAVAIPADAETAPRLLQNPHVDFPGTWLLVDDTAGRFRYAKTAQVADPLAR